tara:strand:+ start:607 stop:810 length:204 start_codon:yes stop_codon:yes gene_type:complete
MQKKDPLKTPSNSIDVHKHVRIIRAHPAWPFRITMFLWSKMKVERVMGIEPNEHRIPRFLGKYSSSH